MNKDYKREIFGHKFYFQGNTVKVNDEEKKYMDVIYTRSSLSFGFLDRLRILFGFRVEVQSKTYLEEIANVVTADVDVIVWNPGKDNFGGCDIDKSLTEKL